MFILIKKFVFEFNIVTVNMNSNKPPLSKKKEEKETVSEKTFNKRSCSNDFDITLDTDDNLVKVTYKICTQYLQQIRVQARARDLHESGMHEFAKSGGLHDWAKKKFSFHQSPETSETANLSAQHKSPFSQSGQNGQASTIVRIFYGPTTKEYYRRLIVKASTHCPK